MLGPLKETQKRDKENHKLRQRNSTKKYPTLQATPTHLKTKKKEKKIGPKKLQFSRHLLPVCKNTDPTPSQVEDGEQAVGVCRVPPPLPLPPLLSGRRRVGSEGGADVRAGPELRRRAALRDVRRQRQRPAAVHPRHPRRPPDQGKERGLPFNRYAWLTTHNSFARLGQRSQTGTAITTLFNQQDTVTSQLNNGVRGLMLDMYDFRNDIWLCHSFRGVCQNFTAFEPAINVLREIERFLARNPSQVITIFIEDYVESPMGLSKVFNASGLMKYWFPVSRMPKNGGDWPLLSDMVRDNHRLLVFTSKAAKESTEGIAYEWRYVIENQYGSKGMIKGLCPKRAESADMNDVSRSLVLINYFKDIPNFPGACKDNSAQLLDMLNTCHDTSGDRWANFIAVDFYKRSDRGGAAEATDKANGGLICGCGSISACNANGTCTPSRHGTPRGIFNSTSDATARRPPMSLKQWRLALSSTLLATLFSL